MTARLTGRPTMPIPTTLVAHQRSSRALKDLFRSSTLDFTAGVRQDHPWRWQAPNRDPFSVEEVSAATPRILEGREWCATRSAFAWGGSVTIPQQLERSQRQRTRPPEWGGVVRHPRPDWRRAPCPSFGVRASRGELGRQTPRLRARRAYRLRRSSPSFDAATSSGLSAQGSAGCGNRPASRPARQDLSSTRASRPLSSWS